MGDPEEAAWRRYIRRIDTAAVAAVVFFVAVCVGGTWYERSHRTPPEPPMMALHKQWTVVEENAKAVCHAQRQELVSIAHVQDGFFEVDCGRPAVIRLKVTVLGSMLRKPSLEQ